VEGVYLNLDNAQQAAREYPNAQWQRFFSAEQLRLEWTRYCDRASWRDGRKVAWEHGWATLDEAQPLTERSTGCISQARELRCAGDRDTDKRRLENVKDAQGGRRHQMYYAVATDQATVISAHEAASVDRFAEWQGLGYEPKMMITSDFHLARRFA